MTCGSCLHFSECQKVNVKNVRSDTPYCQFRPSRYERKV